MKRSILFLVVFLIICRVYAEDEVSSSTGEESSSSSSTGSSFHPESNSTDCLDPIYFKSNTTRCQYQSTIMPIGDIYSENGTYVDYRYNLSQCELWNLSTTKLLGAYRKLQQVPVCIKMGGLQKIVFFPAVDDYTLMQVASLVSQRYRYDDPNMWIQLEVAIASVTVVSPPKPRMRKTTPTDGTEPVFYVVPYWVAIVIMKDGIPNRIEWDDGCYGCSGDSCIADTCAIEGSTCYQNGLDCDIKVYIGWFGTDVDGQYLISAGKRPSRFKQYSISSAVTSAALTAYDNLPEAPTWSGNTDDFNPNPDPNG